MNLRLILRRGLLGLLILGLLGILFLGRGYWNATRDPIVRRAEVQLANWPADTPPLKVMLVSDTHVAGPDMPPERLERIFAQLNKERPDLILLAGDYISEKSITNQLYSAAEITAPMKQLKAQLGVVAVMGNHDYWADIKGITAEMRKAGVTVLVNDAVQRGPVIIGGIDDEWTRHDDIAATYAAMDALDVKETRTGVGTAPRILITHGPDVVPDLPRSPNPVATVFTGHTHCSQIVLPIIGPVTYISRYGARFNCGDITDNGQRVFVSAGLGTSILPLRYGAHPDVWVVTMKAAP